MKRKMMNKSSKVSAAIDMLLARSHQDVQEGKTLPHTEVMKQAAQWLKEK